MEEPAPERRSLRIELAPRTIAMILLTVLGLWLAWQLSNVVIVVTIALVLVGTFDPLVAWLERRGFGRGRALVLVFFVFALAVVGVILLTIPPLVAQLQHIIEDAPSERRKLVAFLGQYKWANPFVKAIRAVPLDDLVLSAGNTALSYSAELLTAIGYAITTLFLSIYLLADPYGAKSVLYALTPRHHHVKLARILLELKRIVGGYMRGQLITSVAITIFTFTVLTIFRVDDALALAMFAGLTDIIPFVGGYIASAPAVIAVSSQGTPIMLLVAGLMFLYQEFESRILVPRVYGRVLRLPPAMVLVALLVGGTLMGVLGALLALPIAAGLQMIVRELRVELPGQAPPDEAIRRRDSKAEHIYERLTAGAPVEQAQEIAGRLALKMKANEKTGAALMSAEYEIPDSARRPDDPEK
ncbi:MAG: family transporter [Myxococcales bacterium]|nr:family transporter [Myxococcales bacterium]